ncbi:uncharacterized protein [Gossypium hirsutum]|uniref:Gag-Pol polyprotein n=1 Tax=Gossypium hirsutum TaxID=3635 RepID=A0A1U8IDI7_GOSHI|nr:uncharacterized protein LOC107895509 [Gossypium hirsutum]
MGEARVPSKRSSGKTHLFLTKKSRSHQERSTSLVGYSGRARRSKCHNPKSSSLMVTSVGSVDDLKPRCNSCNKFHFGECRMKSEACCRCGSLDYFLRDCPEPPRHPGSASGSRIVSKDTTTKSEAQASVRTYAIHAREEASALDVITGIFSIYDTLVIGLVDPGSTHSYICMKLVSGMDMSMEPTEFVIKVSNPLGKYMRKGYEAYFTFVLNTKESELKIESVPIVHEYPDVFPKELYGWPSVREVEFGIELVPGKTPISIAPYRMAPTEL